MAERDIKRGDIYIADLEPVRGSEEGKMRRVLIVSNDIGNKVGPVVVALPITTQVTEKRRRMPMFAELHSSQENGQTYGLVDCTQIRVLSKKDRLIEYKGYASTQVMRKVDTALEMALALKRCPYCDHVLMPHKRHCVNCEVKLIDICNACSHEVDTRHRFCPNCGVSRRDNGNE